MANNDNEIKKLAEKIIALCGGGEEQGATFPTPDEVDGMKNASVKAVAEEHNIDISDVEDPKALLKTAAEIVHGEEVSDEEQLEPLCVALGFRPSKKKADTIKEIAAFLSAAKDEEDAGAEESDDDEDAKPAAKKSSKKPAAKTEDEDEDDDEDAKPAKSKKSKVDDEDEDDDDKDGDDDKDEEGDGEGEQETSLTSKELKAYNKLAKKPLADVDALAAKLTDDDGKVAEWGEAYFRGETACCCGFPLEDVEVEIDGKTKEAGQCRVTQKIFVQDKKSGKLVEVETE